MNMENSTVTDVSSYSFQEALEALHPSISSNLPEFPNIFLYGMFDIILFSWV